MLEEGRGGRTTYVRGLAQFFPFQSRSDQGSDCLASSTVCKSPCPKHILHATPSPARATRLPSHLPCGRGLAGGAVARFGACKNKTNRLTPSFSSLPHPPQQARARYSCPSSLPARRGSSSLPASRRPASSPRRSCRRAEGGALRRTKASSLLVGSQCREGSAGRYCSFAVASGDSAPHQQPYLHSTHAHPP